MQMEETQETNLLVIGCAVARAGHNCSLAMFI